MLILNSATLLTSLIRPNSFCVECLGFLIHTVSGHLHVTTFLPLPFQSGCLLFLFIVWLLWLRLPMLSETNQKLMPVAGNLLSKRNWHISSQELLGNKIHLWTIMSCFCCSVTKSCPPLCNAMDCSTPGFPVLHYLPEFAQTHVHGVDDAIQLSHPLSHPSPPAFNLSQHQGLFQGVSPSHQVAKGSELQLQHQSFQWIFQVDFL